MYSVLHFMKFINSKCISEYLLLNIYKIKPEQGVMKVHKPVTLPT